MTRQLPMLILLIFATFLATACGLLRDSEEASGPIEAIPLDLETDTPAQEPGAPQAQETEQDETGAYPPPAQNPSGEQETAAAYPPPQEEKGPNTAYPDAAYPATDDASDGQAPQTSDGSQLRVYQISQEASQVTFELDEDLRGERTTVVGRTDQVAGEMALNLDDLSTARLGVIQINARTLLTENNFRNRAIQNEILETGAYEFITFTPTAIIGLPAATAVGEEVAFTVEGDLTIRNITQPVSFEVVASVPSETELSGRATTIVEREAFGLRIPQVRDVANVEDVVELTIQFVALAT